MTSTRIVLKVILGAGVLCPHVSLADMEHISATTRNGGFEAGTNTPWSGVVATTNAPFAYAGAWFAEVSATAPGGTARSVAFVRFPASPKFGRHFLLAFHARLGSPSFEELRPSIYARNADTSWANATSSKLVFPSPSEGEWREYRVLFEMPPTWDGSGDLYVSIQFTKYNAITGTTYKGYLDAVHFVQLIAPTLSGIDIGATNLTLSFTNTVPGGRYALESCPGLEAGNWELVTEIASDAFAGQVSLSMTNAEEKAFFRLNRRIE